MKKYFLFKIASVFTILVILCSLTVKTNAAKAAQDENIKDIIESKNYSFTVTHESGGNFAIGNYYFQMMNDSLSASLPYNGNSGVAAYTTDDNGINVHTKDFSYQSTPVKNGGYVITIKLNNDRMTQSFSFKVNKKGYATLSVESTNRDPASFYGVINGI